MPLTGKTPVNSWNIIGWLLLALFIGLPLVKIILAFFGRCLLWLVQKDIRTTPKKWDRWQSIWGGPVYRINDVHIREAPSYDSVVVSTDPNNMGGWHEPMPRWIAMVRRNKLVKVN